jgi:hypothetical protein
VIQESKKAMLSLFKFLSELFSPSLADAQERHDEYLSQAADMHDLEVRVRHLDAGHRSIYRTGPHGVFMR